MRPAESFDAHVLAVTSDAALAQRLSRLAEAAGVPLVTRSAPSLHDCSQASLVLLGADAAGRWAARRPGVVLVADGDADPEVWKIAVTVGAENVAVLPTDERRLLERLADAVSRTARAPVVGLIGGRGGGGASTLAVALAGTAAAQGIAALLLDLDPIGGGLDLALGAEHDPGLRWADLVGVRGRLQPRLLRTGLPCVNGLPVLTWGRQGPGELAPEAATAVIAAAAREAELVVIDLPRSVGDAEAAALAACGRVIMVVPAEVRATAAAARLATRLSRQVADLGVVVRGPAPTGLAAETIADTLGLPLLGELRPEPGLAEAIDRGTTLPLRSRGPLGQLCARLLPGLLEPAMLEPGLLEAAPW